MIDLSATIQRYKEELDEILKNKFSNIETLVPKIALLMLIENFYNWNVGTFIGNPHVNEKLDKQLKKFLKWKKNCYDPFELLQISGFSIPEVKKCTNASAGRVNISIRWLFGILYCN